MKNKIVEICKVAYNYLIKKGLNSTISKVIISALFGIACAYFLSGCSVTYENDGVEFKGSILTPIEGDYK